MRCFVTDQAILQVFMVGFFSLSLSLNRFACLSSAFEFVLLSNDIESNGKQPQQQQPKHRIKIGI